MMNETSRFARRVTLFTHFRLKLSFSYARKNQFEKKKFFQICKQIVQAIDNSDTKKNSETSFKKFSLNQLFAIPEEFQILKIR